MDLSAEYHRQFAWRPWQRILESLPAIRGLTVLDLGCGIGDLAAEFVGRGARVIGIDANRELIDTARAKGLANAEFRIGDLRDVASLSLTADAIWCSFSAAYFPQLSKVLASWEKQLWAGGWIALTEIDDLFGHEPLSPRAKELFRAYGDESFIAGRYDFQMGRKLREHLSNSGFSVLAELRLDDQELAFQGSAAPNVIDAWRMRLDRMTMLREFCGSEFDAVRDEFLGCLARPDHRSTAQVYTCIARK